MVDVNSQDNSGWKVPQEVSSPTSCSQQGHLQEQTTLLRAVSCQVLKTFTDKDCTPFFRQHKSLSQLFAIISLKESMVVPYSEKNWFHTLRYCLSYIHIFERVCEGVCAYVYVLRLDSFGKGELKQKIF